MARFWWRPVNSLSSPLSFSLLSPSLSFSLLSLSSSAFPSPSMHVLLHSCISFRARRAYKTLNVEHQQRPQDRLVYAVCSLVAGKGQQTFSRAPAGNFGRRSSREDSPVSSYATGSPWIGRKREREDGPNDSDMLLLCMLLLQSLLLLLLWAPPHN